MSDDRAPAADTELQFDKAEPAGVPTRFSCASCQATITTEYFETGGKIVCAGCKGTIAAAIGGGGGMDRFILAAVYGLGAAIAGALLWWGVRAVTGYEIGLVAIAVGFMVGFAVRKGSQGLGGRRYQILAVALTYTGAALNYAPDVVKGMVQANKTPPAETKTAEGTQPTPPTTASNGPAKAAESAAQPVTFMTLVLALGLVVAVSFAAPFLAGTSNIIGLLIIAFALWEAWKMNRGVTATFTGPFPVVANEPEAAAAGAAP